MKMIVGLGNPGKEYENTRHNIGFYFLDLFAEEFPEKFKEKFHGSYKKIFYNGEDIILLKPKTYMNLSGDCVYKFMHYYKILPEDLLIIQDDLDLEVGRIKLKLGGSSGGHNGIQNIIDTINTQEFLRLKIGISKNSLYDTKDYVLGKFSIEDLEIYNTMNEKIKCLLKEYLKIPLSDLMSKYNRR